MTGVTGIDDELERRAEFYHADWLYDAVDRVTEANSQMAAAAAAAAGAEGGDEE